MIHLLAQNVETLLQTTKKSAPRQYAILQALKNGGGPLSFSQLQTKVHAKNIHAVLSEMQERGWISVEEEIEKPKAKPKIEQVVNFTTEGCKVVYR